MACLQGCSDCECQEVKPCDDNETVETDLKRKLKILKQFACVLETTPCPNIAHIVGRYAWFVWCFLKDLVNLIMSLRKRTDDLYQVAECLNSRIDTLVEYFIEQAKGNVENEIGTATGGGGSSTGVTTYMKSTSDRDGNFTFTWNMTQPNGVVGNGVISGKINQSYSVDDEGNMVVDIKSATIAKVKYTPTGLAPFTTKPGRIQIANIFDKSYATNAAFEETINKDISFDIKKVVTPHSSTGRIELFRITDTWELDPTTGVAFVNYTNNNNAIPTFTSCPIEPKC